MTTESHGSADDESDPLTRHPRSGGRPGTGICGSDDACEATADEPGPEKVVVPRHCPRSASSLRAVLPPMILVIW
jgi:hypothetical protein